MSSRQLHLNVNLLHSGVYASAWRLPESDPRAFFDVGHYVRVARIAERGKLDAIFLADTPAVTDRIDYRPFLSMEPTIVLATVAASTSHIGLIATASTTYNEPYNIARRFATLDHSSGGRVGWNAVTTADAAASRNFGFPTCSNIRRATTAQRSLPKSFMHCGTAGRTTPSSVTRRRHGLSTPRKSIRSRTVARIIRWRAR
jgi:alkanesulfonate monooxygenase SsuD/methylene tetrahydromethanopterin reductase-like flavin-dependent oxidoreductase (luciferase family)